MANSMDPECLPKSSRMTLIIANILNIIGGIVIIAGGIWLKTGAAGATNSFVQTTATAGSIPIVVIVAGAILLLTGIIGFAAAKYENKFLLGCFGTILFVTLVIVLVVGVYALIIGNSIDKPEFGSALDKKIQSQMATNPDGVCLAYQLLQCSGGSQSCFEFGFAANMCPANCPAATDPWATVSCQSRISGPIRSWFLAIGIVCIVWALVLVSGLVMVCCVCARKKTASGPYTTTV
eukprot:tig00020904_g15171.t1